MKPIERVYLNMAGDPSVGIWPTSHQAEVYIDPSCMDDPKAWLEEIRAGFAKLYELMEGEPVTVKFDFELDLEPVN